MRFHISVSEAREQFQNVATPFVALLQNGSMQVEYFAPEITDTQAPHK